jgi:DNA recombination protein RmuC
LGEEILYDALKQCIPQEQYETQYKFKDGNTVDALIKTSAGLIPIDSKFPMDNYAQMLKASTEQESVAAKREFVNAVRKHLRDIAQKYILPQEGTVNFALMYVPSEGVYYEIISQYEELTQYARELHVTPISPNSLYQYLYIIMMSLERSKLEKEAGRVWELLKGIQQETGKFGEKISVLSRHLTNAKSAMDGVVVEYDELNAQVQGVKLLE